VNILPHVCLWTRKSPLNFVSHPNPEPGSGFWIQTTGFALVDVCYVHKLMI